MANITSKCILIGCFFWGAHLVAEPLMDLEVQVESAIAKKAKDIRTLYIVVYDEAQTSPMPYGALKVDLSSAPNGVVYKGALTSENLKMMNPQAAKPKSIKVKARLDLDGSAGSDEKGDFVVTKTGIGLGEKVVLKIDKEV